MSNSPHTPSGGRMKNDLTRRKFLRNTAVTATALSYSRIAARAAGKEPSDALNIGLVGCGQQGMAALTASMKLIPGIRFAAIADVWDFKRQSALLVALMPATAQIGMKQFIEREVG